jgi:AcrR family transcriptional regulator
VTDETRELPRTATGRVPGPKGIETRRRLLEAVEQRCVRTYHGTITVAEIAQAADTSAATFYHYFPDVAAAAAEVAATHLAEFDAVIDLANTLARKGAPLEDCRTFVAAFFEFWTGRPGLIEAVVVASTDEDPRFFKVLLRALTALTTALARAVPTGHPTGVAGSLVMMLSQAAARNDGFERDGVPLHELVESQALILHRVLTDQGVDGP